LWFSCSSEAVAITDIAGGGNHGLYFVVDSLSRLTPPDNERPGDPTPRFNCCLHRLGARTFALNLSQLRGCPPHWDLDEIPVIATGFSILSRQRGHLGTLAVTAPAGARDAEPAERRYLRLPAVGAGGIGCSSPSSTPRSRNSVTPKFDPRHPTSQTGCSNAALLSGKGLLPDCSGHCGDLFGVGHQWRI
jgi:hypothetical protein